MLLYSLKEAGYPFNKNDLSISEWLDMASINPMIKEELSK